MQMSFWSAPATVGFQSAKRRRAFSTADLARGESATSILSICSARRRRIFDTANDTGSSTFTILVNLVIYVSYRRSAWLSSKILYLDRIDADGHGFLSGLSVTEELQFWLYE